MRCAPLGEEMSRVYRALEKAEKEKKEGVEEGPSVRILEEKPSIQAESTPEPRKGKKTTELKLPPKEETPLLKATPDSFSAEEFKKLRTHIFHHASQPHSILVTSAGPGEGKTMVAVNLATAISQEFQKKAILIDADLRKPGIYIESHPDSKGLSDYLSNQTLLSEILLDSGTENLRVILSGASTPKGAELIGLKKMRDLFASFRESSGEDTYVIVDSSPLLSTSEPALLSKMVDGVILVVMAGQTQRDSIQRAIKSIDRQKIIGVVLNQTALKSVDSYSKLRRRKEGVR